MIWGRMRWEGGPFTPTVLKLLGSLAVDPVFSLPMDVEVHVGGRPGDTEGVGRGILARRGVEKSAIQVTTVLIKGLFSLNLMFLAWVVFSHGEW